MGLRQQLRVVLFSHTSLYRVLNANAPTPAICCSWRAGIYWLIFSITAAVRGHFQLMIGYSRAPYLIYQRAIDAKGRDGNAAHRAGGQLVMDLPTAVGKALHNGLQRPLATARPARAKRNSFSSTSAGIDVSSASCTSCP